MVELLTLGLSKAGIIRRRIIVTASPLLFVVIVMR